MQKNGASMVAASADALGEHLPRDKPHRRPIQRLRKRKVLKLGRELALFGELDLIVADQLSERQ
jgi:hypothetical protein